MSGDDVVNILSPIGVTGVSVSDGKLTIYLRAEPFEFSFAAGEQVNLLLDPLELLSGRMFPPQRLCPNVGIGIRDMPLLPGLWRAPLKGPRKRKVSAATLKMRAAKKAQRRARLVTKRKSR